MPSPDEHSTRARHNQEFAAFVRTNSPAYCDWAVIALFYSALHMLEAYLATSGEHPEGHAERGRAFQEHSALAPAWEDYRMLKDYSEDARYRCREFAPAEAAALEAEEFQRATQFLYNDAGKRPGSPAGKSNKRPKSMEATS